MSYAALHDFCQSQDIPISRSQLYPKIKKLCGIEKLVIRKTGMCVDNVLGFFVRPGTEIAAMPNWVPGVATVVVSRDLNYCWERFVVIKELMHLFDSELDKLGAAEEFESLIAEMIGPLPERSVAMESEIVAFWRAIGIVCPEAKRQEFHRQRDAGRTSNLDIATALRMPELYVSALFEPNYKAILSSMM